MKGLICYFSTTGNTYLACQYITKKMNSIEFELYDITKNELPDISLYDVIGFATFTASLGPPVLMQDFLQKLPFQNQKYAFIFNTYANLSGQTVRMMKKLLLTKGFIPITSHSLHTPENYPPYIIKGIIHENAPNYRELKQFESFIIDLDLCISKVKNQERMPKVKFQFGVLNNLLPMLPKKRSQKKMGQKFVDLDLCNECGICKNSCPYKAIQLNPKPVFDNEKCYGCWSCYNHCPMKAIYTAKIRGIGQYPKENDLLRSKLKI